MPLTSKPSTTEIDADHPDVLLVDDDGALRETLSDTLQAQGFATMSAANGSEALRLIADRPPRVIVLDLEMPVMNGWQFLERRRRERRLREIPVLVLSALPAHGVPTAGADGQLEKPVDERELAEAIEKLLTRTAPPAVQAPVRKRILVIDDDDDTRASVSELLEDYGYDVSRAANGSEGEERLRDQPRPGCIILDLWMPVMNGWSFITRLQQFGARPIPIIVITAAEPHWGYPVPLTHVVRKPIPPDRLLAVLDKLAPRTTATTSPADPAPGAVPLAGGHRKR